MAATRFEQEKISKQAFTDRPLAGYKDMRANEDTPEHETSARVAKAPVRSVGPKADQWPMWPQGSPYSIGDYSGSYRIHGHDAICRTHMQRKGSSSGSGPATEKEMLLRQELAGLRMKYELLLASDRKSQEKPCGLRKIRPLPPYSTAVQTDQWFTGMRLLLGNQKFRLSLLKELKQLLPYHGDCEWLNVCTSVEEMHQTYMRFFFPNADLWGEYCTLLYQQNEGRFPNWRVTSRWVLNIARLLSNANSYHELRVPSRALQSMICSALQQRCPVDTDIVTYQEVTRRAKTLQELCATMRKFEDLTRRRSHTSIANCATESDHDGPRARRHERLNHCLRATIDPNYSRMVDRSMARVDENTNRRKDYVSSVPLSVGNAAAAGVGSACTTAVPTSIAYSSSASKHSRSQLSRRLRCTGTVTNSRLRQRRTRPPGRHKVKAFDLITTQ